MKDTKNLDESDGKSSKQSTANDASMAGSGSGLLSAPGRRQFVKAVTASAALSAANLTGSVSGRRTPREKSRSIQEKAERIRRREGEEAMKEYLRNHTDSYTSKEYEFGSDDQEVSAQDDHDASLPAELSKEQMEFEFHAYHYDGEYNVGLQVNYDFEADWCRGDSNADFCADPKLTKAKSGLGLYYRQQGTSGFSAVRSSPYNTFGYFDRLQSETEPESGYVGFEVDDFQAKQDFMSDAGWDIEYPENRKFTVDLGTAWVTLRDNTDFVGTDRDRVVTGRYTWAVDTGTLADPRITLGFPPTIGISGGLGSVDDKELAYDRNGDQIAINAEEIKN